ncbi:MAG: hypothetical protein ABIK28_06535 [Planctomycetota bacterium]
MDCAFIRNTSKGYGGAVGSEACDPTVINSTFLENSADDFGGGIGSAGYNPVIVNCSFFGNRARNHGGGIGNDQAEPVVTNCILWNNLPDEISGDIPTVTFCDVKGGYPGWKNLDADPRFGDPGEGDFHLRFTSPCLNAGYNSAIGDRDDFEDDPRICQGIVDLGADEFYPHLYCTGLFKPGHEIKAGPAGIPGTSPVVLFIGSGISDPPRKYQWGFFHLEGSLFVLPLGSIPSDGMLKIPGRISELPAGPYTVPMQALIGNHFSNLFEVEISG